MVFPNIVNGFNVPITVTLAGLAATIANGHVSNTIPATVTTSGGRAYVGVAIKGDQAKTGNFEMKGTITGTSYSAAATVVDTSLPPETVITVASTYNNRYVIGKELFKKQEGRYPTSTDKVRFVVPAGVNLIGIPMTFSYFDWDGTQGGSRVYNHSSAGLDLNMDAQLITVEVYGSIIGAPGSARTTIQTAPTEVKWDMLAGTSAAIAGRVPVNLIIRSTGKVLGHGGWDPQAPGEVEILNQPNGTDFDTGKGTAALGTIAGSKGNFTVRVDSGGILNGGGGGGGQGGTALWQVLTPVYCPMTTRGGGGAPYGGRFFILQGNTGDPVSPVKFTYNDMPATQAVCTQGSSYTEVAYSPSATLTTPGAPLARVTIGGGLPRDYVSGAGGAYGQPGQAGVTYQYGSMSAATRASISRPGKAGTIAENADTTVVYNNSIV